MDYPPMNDPDFPFLNPHLANMVLAVLGVLALWVLGAPFWFGFGFFWLATMVARAHVAALASAGFAELLFFDYTAADFLEDDDEGDEEDGDGIPLIFA
jgi:hypothetical protein